MKITQKTKKIIERLTEEVINEYFGGMMGVPNINSVCDKCGMPANACECQLEDDKRNNEKAELPKGLKFMTDDSTNMTIKKGLKEDKETVKKCIEIGRKFRKADREKDPQAPILYKELNKLWDKLSDEERNTVQNSVRNIRENELNPAQSALSKKVGNKQFSKSLSNVYTLNTKCKCGHSRAAHEYGKKCISCNCQKFETELKETGRGEVHSDSGMFNKKADSTIQIINQVIDDLQNSSAGAKIKISDICKNVMKKLPKSINYETLSNQVRQALKIRGYKIDPINDIDETLKEVSYEEKLITIAKQIFNKKFSELSPEQKKRVEKEVPKIKSIDYLPKNWHEFHETLSKSIKKELKEDVDRCQCGHTRLVHDESGCTQPRCNCTKFEPKKELKEAVVDTIRYKDYLIKIHKLKGSYMASTENGSYWTASNSDKNKVINTVKSAIDKKEIPIKETTPNAVKRDIVQKIPGLECPKCHSTNVDQVTNEPAMCAECGEVFSPNDINEEKIVKCTCGVWPKQEWPKSAHQDYCPLRKMNTKEIEKLITNKNEDKNQQNIYAILSNSDRQVTILKDGTILIDGEKQKDKSLNPQALVQTLKSNGFKDSLKESKLTKEAQQWLNKSRKAK